MVGGGWLMQLQPPEAMYSTVQQSRVGNRGVAND